MPPISFSLSEPFFPGLYTSGLLTPHFRHFDPSPQPHTPDAPSPSLSPISPSHLPSAPPHPLPASVSPPPRLSSSLSPLHLPSLLSCESAINTSTKDLESIQALAPLAPSYHPFLKVLEYPSSLFQAPGLGWGENRAGGGERDAVCSTTRRWGGGLLIEVASPLFCDGWGGVMETGTHQESLHPPPQLRDRLYCA